MSFADGMVQYEEALKGGKKYYKSCVHNGTYPYLTVLDEIVESSQIVASVDIGVIDIPTELIVGTKTSGRHTAFAGDFMPLMPLDTEFAHKWISLCDAHLSEGIREPVRCYEYLGRFYVEEGNKRVSVLRSFGSPAVPGRVERLIPVYSSDKEIAAYYEFMEFYKLSRTYRFRFDKSGSYTKLQAALGFEAEHQWTTDEKRSIRSSLFYFESAVRQHHADVSQIILSDAFLVWLQLYSLEAIKNMSEAELVQAVDGIWRQVLALDSDAPITLSTQEPAAPNLSFIEKLTMRSHVNVAFIHEMSAEKSGWIRAHEEGRMFLEKNMGSAVTTKAYFLNGIDEAEEVMDSAIADGAQLIITTTPPLITACRRIAAKHNNSIDILNCSVSMPYPGVRTYYSRIYEGKFVSGAIAGAICKNGTIGYVASSPIFGVPAAINAFALGAMMTNPNVSIKLVWSCSEEKPVEKLLEQGISVISNRDIPTRNQPMEHWGLCTVNEQGELSALASPYWNWGNFYIKVVSGILNGSWKAFSSSDGVKAVNFWWGMLSGAVGVRLSEDLPVGIYRLANILKSGLKDGTIDPFQTRLVAQDGTVKNDGTRILSTEEIISMDWLCECVDGHIPQFDELLPMSQEIVRLLGIYRGWLPPEKGGILL